MANPKPDWIQLSVYSVYETKQLNKASDTTLCWLVSLYIYKHISQVGSQHCGTINPFISLDNSLLYLIIFHLSKPSSLSSILADDQLITSLVSHLFTTSGM